MPQHHLDSSLLQFSFLTLNTMGALFKPQVSERYQKITASLIKTNAEFFALQEVFHVKKSRDWILGPLQNRNFKIAHAHQFSYRKFKSVGSGLASISKHPITKEEFYSFKFSKSVDRFSNKGVLLTRLMLQDNIEIDFYNTHLQASYLYRHQNAKTRLRQLHELSEFVFQHSSPKNTVIIVGDFNFKENTKEYTYFLDELWHNKHFHFLEIMRSLYPQHKDTLYTYQHLRRKNLQEKLDHKFMHIPDHWKWVKEKSSSEILNWNVSDHSAILTQLTFMVD